MTSTSDSEIRSLIQQWIDAVKHKNLEGIAAPYSDDICAFDAIQTLQFKGKAAYRAHWEKCLEYCQGNMVFECEQLQIHGGSDVAFAHWLNKCGSGAEGEESCYMRVTMGLQRLGGQWQVVHEHWSAPFDMETQKALFNLKP
ncbi:YybH family protein [Pseudomonas fontis]|uniref:Nuclear transport factor 2 family protein n=1 Tax=Pseudomonas fontis TaxID=2942633 RepID=A0ABT5P0L2_9PSED|nr:nuclear transport factor 2 family protein [Pseudomonas fontis]MDD0972808.1 nuclear transport factor 2 family protein [Pseudomonas fontis]MDD0993980.1 nuclear transport factor 2 family protein [Pseudomonas fontis]